jgi:UDP-N-acetylglucosamine 1-carboxyvinyltransferase
MNKLKTGTVKVQKSRLQGKVKLSGAKNSSLRLLAATLLTDDPILLKDVPITIDDFRIHLEMLEAMGKTIHLDGDDSVLVTGFSKNTDLRYEGRSIRNTLLILGCQLTKYGRGSVPLPGGCKLGERKYDLHVRAMEALGARVWDEGDFLFAEAPSGLTGADIHLSLRSTGATENGILMGCLAGGTTTVWNPHIRPEILDLIEMLRSMGAQIEVNGQESIVIHGVKGLSGTEHTCIPDNMEALTLAIAAAMTGGDVEITNFPYDALEVPMIFLRESGLNFYRSAHGDSLLIKPGPIYPIEISTGPYPGINSDMQPLFAAYATLARGKSKIVELRFAGRFLYAKEMAAMGVTSEVVGDALVIHGGNQLKGAEVAAVNLRAGAALLLCGLVAEGETTITNFIQVERGYEHVVMKLKSLGAKVDYV